MRKMRRFIAEGGHIMPVLSEQELRSPDTGEVDAQIESFTRHFSDKGITAGFEFGVPQPLKIYATGVVWSGRINGIVNWNFTASVNANDRVCTVWIAQSEPLELSDNTLSLMGELKSYFDIFTDKWMETEFTANSQSAAV